MPTGPHTSIPRFVDYARAVAESFAGPGDARTPAPVARCGLNRVHLHDTSHVTGKGTLADPFVWDGTVWGGSENYLIDGYWTLTATAKLVASGTVLIGQGLPKVTYTGTGDAIHVHDAEANDANTANASTTVNTFHQRVENIWIHVNGSATGSAVAGNAIDIDQSHNAVVRNCRVSGRWANAFWIGNCTNWRLENPVVSGSAPGQYDWNLADSPDNAVRLGRRSGSSFAGQNGVILNPWLRFCKGYGVYSDAGDFGTTIIGGQIGDCGRNLICYASFAEGLTVIGTDTEFGPAPTATLDGNGHSTYDADGNGVAISLTGRGHLFLNPHTFGSIQLNDSFEVSIRGGRAGKVWFQSSTGCRVEDTFLIGGGSRLWDAGTSGIYYVRTRADQPPNATGGFGEYDQKFIRTMGGSLIVGSDGTAPLAFDNAAVTGWNGAWVGSGTRDTTNYTLLANAARTTTLLNAAAGGTVGVRINNSPALTVDATGTGFNGAAVQAKPTVTGSRGGNAALASLLTKLATYGLITDGTSA